MKTRIVFIKVHKNQYPINFMCKVLQINRSTIYKKHIVKPNEDNLLDEIHNIFVKHKSCYGYRRLKIAIEKEIGLIINHKKLLKIMRNADIFSN